MQLLTYVDTFALYLIYCDTTEPTCSVVFSVRTLDIAFILLPLLIIAMERTMSLYKQYTRNSVRLVEGAPLTLGIKDGDPNKLITLWVSRAHDSNPEYKAALAAVRRKHKQTIDNLKGDAKSDFIEKLAKEVIRDVCIKRWENLDDVNDMPIVDNSGINKLLDDLPEVEDAIIVFATTDTNYVGEFDAKEAVKN